MRLGAAAAAVLILAAGCGNDDSESGDESDLRPRVEADVEAFSDGAVDDAWAMLSERCQSDLNEAEYRAAIAAAGHLYPDLTITGEYSETADGASASVDYDLSSPELNQRDELWAFESGEWHWDDC